MRFLDITTNLNSYSLRKEEIPNESEACSIKTVFFVKDYAQNIKNERAVYSIFIMELDVTIVLPHLINMNSSVTKALKKHNG